MHGEVTTAAMAETWMERHLNSTEVLKLLSASQEREADVSKWNAVRSAQHLLLEHEMGRNLLQLFCEQVIDSPPTLETIEQRAQYFLIRKNIVAFLPGKPGVANLEDVLMKLRQEHSAAELLTLLKHPDWPATLVIGLVVVLLRQLGLDCKDATADALQVWITPLQGLSSAPDPVLAGQLCQFMNDYMASRDTLIKHNIRLVYKLAMQHRYQSVPLSDLAQDGCAGLLRAAEKYDYRLGYRFSTYAYNWINQQLQSSYKRHSSLVGYPANVQAEINHLYLCRMGYREAHGIEPGFDELAQLAKMPVEKVQKLRKLTNITVSLDQPITGSSELNWAETLPDVEAQATSRPAEEMLMNRLVHRRMENLEEMERHVVSARFGLLGREPLTLRELAQELDISSEWARQLEKSALAKLRGDKQLEEAFCIG
ncbi:MAG: sigma-70 family RNA polymerase sigma factor [Halioglobus sp.]